MNKVPGFQRMKTHFQTAIELLPRIAAPLCGSLNGGVFRCALNTNDYDNEGNLRALAEETTLITSSPESVHSN